MTNSNSVVPIHDKDDSVLVNGKMPIVNGSVNTSLSLEEMLLFSRTQKNSIAWNIIVHNSIYHKIEMPFTHDDISNSQDINQVLTDIYNADLEIKSNLLKELRAKELNEGRLIFEHQNTLKFNAEFYLTPFQMIGYLNSHHNFNNFYSYKVSRAIMDSEAIIPGLDYGINNPNTGSRSHQWSIKLPYIFLYSGYTTGKSLQNFIDIESKLSTIWNHSALADSFRHEIHTNPIFEPDAPEYNCGITYTMWWD